MLIEKLNKILYQFKSYYLSIISICFQKEDIFVVEIKKTLREIEIIKSNHYKNSEDVFDNINTDFNLKEKRITVNFYPSSGSFKLLEIPQMPKVEIDTWLIDNASDFLPTGLSINDICLSFKIVRSINVLHLLLGILNHEDINSLINKLKKTEGILTKITPGYLNSVKIDETEKDETGIHNYYIEHEDYHELIIFEKDSLLYYNQLPQAFQSQNRIDAIQKLFSEDLQLLNIEIIEEDLKVIELDKYSINDTRIEKKYSFAYTLALSELKKYDSFNLLPYETLLNSELIAWKQTFLRFSIVVGISVFITYLVAFLFVFIISSVQQGIEEDRAILSPQLSQINLLQTQKFNLENDLRAARQVKQYRSNSSILLDMFSFHIPNNCWLTEITYDGDSEKSFNTTLEGMSKDESKINTFIKNLELDKNIKSVKLDYINKLTRDEMYRDWKIRSSLYLEFQISVEY